MHVIIGDSLTHGMYVYDEGNERIWQKVHPYSIQLQKSFNDVQRLSSVKVIEKGISGERTHSMVGRLPSELHSTKPKLVIILGGTNDLFSKISADKIIRNVINLHQLALKYQASSGHTTYTIAVTIPQLPMDSNNKEVNEKRLEVNKGIRAFAKKCDSRVTLFEMESLFDQNNLVVNKKYWSVDNVHFSPLGYDTIGQLLYKLILDFRVASTKSSEEVLRCFDNEHDSSTIKHLRLL